MKRQIYRVISWGGVGDVLLTTPAIRALKTKTPNCRIIFYYIAKKHGDIFRNNPHISAIKSTSILRNPLFHILHLFKKIKWYRGSYVNLIPGLFSNKNVTSVIAEMLDVDLENGQLEFFPTKKEEEEAKMMLSAYSNPIILHITSLTSKNQMWPLANWVSLIKSMPGYTFIQLGKINEEPVSGAIDLRGKTTIRQALTLLKYARSFVGVVSSFSHATNAFGTPGVVLFGASTPVVWGHANNINLYKNLRCAPCIETLWHFKCPYESRCMTLITVGEVRTALLHQLNKET